MEFTDLVVYALGAAGLMLALNIPWLSILPGVVGLIIVHKGGTFQYGDSAKTAYTVQGGGFCMFSVAVCIIVSFYLTWVG